MKTKSLAPLAILLLALSIQVLASRIFFIGYFGDDANYILLARGLAGARQAAPPDLSLAEHFPAFAFLLAPLVRLFGVASSWLRLISLSAMASAGALLWLLERERIGPGWALCSLSLLVFNATAVRYAGTVMSDPSFIAACLACAFIICEQRQRLALGVCALALTSLLRPQGIIFLAAVLLSGLGREERGRTVRLTVGAAAVYVGVLGLIFLRTGHWTSYFVELARQHGHGFSVAAYLAGLRSTLGLLLPATLCELPPVQDPLLRKIVAWSVIWAAAGLALRGAAASRRDRFIRLCAAYVILSLAALPLWRLRDQRYALVLIPFLSPLLVRGLLGFGRWRVPVAVGIFILLGLCHARGNAINVEESLHPAAERQLPRRTLAFIDAQTGPEARLLMAQATTLQLYTQRPLLRMFKTGTREEFVSRLDRLGITHVVFRELDEDWAVSGSEAPALQKQIAAWVSGSAAFRKVFSDPVEKTEIYAFRP